jgi:hypothetical protein
MKNKMPVSRFLKTLFRFLSFPSFSVCLDAGKAQASSVVLELDRRILSSPAVQIALEKPKNPIAGAPEKAPGEVANSARNHQ